MESESLIFTGLEIPRDYIVEMVERIISAISVLIIQMMYMDREK